MNYSEYEKLRNNTLESMAIIKKEAYTANGQRKERAIEAIQYLAEMLDITNDIFGGVFDDET